MAGETRVIVLGEVAEVRHGFAFDGRYFVDEPSTDVLVTPGNFEIGGGFKSDKLKFYNGPVPLEFVLQPGDLVVTMTDLSKASDTLGFGAIIPSLPGHRLLHNQRIGRVIVTRPDLVERNFLHWILRTPSYRNEVLGSASGSTVKHTAPSRIAAYQFELPPLPTQRAIAHILGALDDKIELNRKTNETLEAMARALFQSWFVDFDPVRAKAAGRAPEGMDEATAKLFPSEFEQSSWGLLPATWSIAPLGDLLSVLETGGRPKGGVGDLSSGVPSIGAESIVGVGKFDYGKTKYVSEAFFGAMKRGVVQNRDVLVYKDGGRPGQLVPHVSMFGDGFPFLKCAINEHVYRVRTADKMPQSFLYFALSSERSLDEMARKGTGVAVPGLNSTAMRSLEVLVPSSSILQVFDRIAEPLIGRIFAGSLQSRTLAALRDALLPKLLSGELAIRDAETFVSRAV